MNICFAPSLDAAFIFAFTLPVCTHTVGWPTPWDPGAKPCLARRCPWSCCSSVTEPLGGLFRAAVTLSTSAAVTDTLVASSVHSRNSEFDFRNGRIHTSLCFSNELALASVFCRGIVPPEPNFRFSMPSSGSTVLVFLQPSHLLLAPGLLWSLFCF